MFKKQTIYSMIFSCICFVFFIISMFLNRSYFEALEKKAEELAKKYDCRFVDNETPYERVEKGHPTIVDYFYHEEVRGTANSGKRNVIHNS